MNETVKTDEPQPRTKPVHQWADDLADTIQIPPYAWRDSGYNVIHYARAGLVVGVLAGCTSLIVNVIGSVSWPAVSGEAQHPLRLIQIYLTFPFGESALQLNSGSALALGCILYLTTGMLYGMLFVLAVSYVLPRADLQVRLMACSILALIVWAINFYALLAWLQPLLVGGRWIAELIPWWVAVFTHLIFGWTVAVVYPIALPISVTPPVGEDVYA
jgi:hypothetical protein